MIGSIIIGEKSFFLQCNVNDREWMGNLEHCKCMLIRHSRSLRWNKILTSKDYFSIGYFLIVKGNARFLLRKPSGCYFKQVVRNWGQVNTDITYFDNLTSIMSPHGH